MSIALSDLLPYAHRDDLPAIARASYAKGNFLESLWLFAALNKAIGIPVYTADVAICKLRISKILQTDDNPYSYMRSGGLAFGDPVISAIASSYVLPVSSNSIAVYTAQFGGYDPVHEPQRKENDIDYYYFTDNVNMHSDVFQIIQIDCGQWPARLVARCFKALPHIFLKQYAQTLWIDSSTYLRGQSVTDIFSAALIEKSIAIHSHRQRDCVYEECEECRLQKKELPHNIDKIRRLLRALRYPDHNGLMETAQVFRNNHADINIFNEIWWYFLKNITVRDQLSLPFILRCLDIDAHILPYSQWSNKFARIYGHSNNMPDKANWPVDIIILVHNNIAITEKCIISLLNNTNYDDYHLHIVDNASTAETKCRLATLRAQFQERITIITNDTNESFSRANNLAFGQTVRPYVLFLNNDVEIIDPNWLSSLVSTMNANKSIGAIGPYLINADYSMQSAGIYLKIYNEKPVMPATHHKIFVNNKYIHAVSGACLLSRRSILSSVGCFDESFIYGQEDVDLCLRIRQKGYIIAVDTQTEVMHHESSTRVWSSQTQKNRDMFIAKWENKLTELRLQQMVAKS